MHDQRAVILRLCALVMAVVEAPIVVWATRTEASGLPAGFVLTLGAIHISMQLLLAALPLHRISPPGRLLLVVRGYVVMNLGFLVASLFVATETTELLLWIVGLGLVYSGVILPLRDHMALTAVVFAAVGVFVAGHGGDVGLVVPVSSIVGMAALAGIGSRVRTVAHSSEASNRQRAEHAADALRAVADSIGQSATIDRQRILDAAVQGAAALDNHQAGVYWLTAGGRKATYAATFGIPESLHGRVFDMDGGIKGEAWRSGATAVTGDYVRHPEAMSDFVQVGIRTAIGTPIRVHDQMVGILVAGRTELRPYSDDEVAAIEMLARTAGSALEVSEQVQADRRVLARLQELERRKEDFVTTVSHELRTPLTVISGLSETLQHHHGDMDAETAATMLQRINANSRSLADIVSTLLDSAGIDRGLLRATTEPVDLTVLAQQCAARLDSLFEPGTLEVSVPESAVTRGDPALLERVVDNLLINALRHTPKGTPVSLSVTDGDDGWELSVTDTGPGIAPEDQGRILSRFERGGDTNARPRGGLGLGLALCEQILGLHQSALQVDSRPGLTTFRFRLPPPLPEGELSGSARAGQASNGRR